MTERTSSLRPRHELRLLQLSIGGLLILVLACALVFAALRSQSDAWADVLFTLYLGALLFALPVACLARPRVRAFALGFALVGSGYATLVFGPWFAETVEPRLATTRVLLALHEYLTPAERELASPALTVRLAGMSVGSGAPKTTSGLAELRAMAQEKFMLTGRLAKGPNDPAVKSAKLQIDLLDGQMLLDSQGSDSGPSRRSLAEMKVASLRLQLDSATKDLQNVQRLSSQGTDPLVAQARAKTRINEIRDQLTVWQTLAGRAPSPLQTVDQFVRTGHTFFGLLLAFAGGMCGLAAAVNRARDDAACTRAGSPNDTPNDPQPI